MQNGICESFQSRLRDELLNETLFFDLSHARSAIARWVADFNTCRPHSARPASGGWPLRQRGARSPRLTEGAPMLRSYALRQRKAETSPTLPHGTAASAASGGALLSDWISFAAALSTTIARIRPAVIASTACHDPRLDRAGNNAAVARGSPARNQCASTYGAIGISPAALVSSDVESVAGTSCCDVLAGRGMDQKRPRATAIADEVSARDRIGSSFRGLRIFDQTSGS